MAADNNLGPQFAMIHVGAKGAKTVASGPLAALHHHVSGAVARGEKMPIVGIESADARHAGLESRWQKSFTALKAAGLEHDADHPVAAEYRAASNAVNHSNRKRDFGIATGRKKK